MKIYPALTEDLTAWALRQPIFFTASAPTHGSHVNVSPKGLSPSHFAVLSPSLVAYVDRTGSGCETAAHAYENGRLTIMFTSFGPAPRILRLFCRAEIVEQDHPDFSALLAKIGDASGCGRRVYVGARAIVRGHVWRVTTSCGFGVPLIRKELLPPGENELYAFTERPTLELWASKQVEKADDAILEYQAANNAKSLDGLPGLKSARRDAGEKLLIVKDVEARVRRLWHERMSVLFGFLLAVLLFTFGKAFKQV
ncbi:hypothetical protein jhhlp_003829 [Lomentospora prolificans]|uniref:Pyridoxamine 5'-phosphate oxidase putative domain-containing protein n=1 Tax=Lomentospora prolificans TaxID=41688 RepID=A0A2N3N9U9_9PEZI|nr:hypothetical protein jhhlp_003829 [Lomentospora prolificans]